MGLVSVDNHMEIASIRDKELEEDDESNNKMETVSITESRNWMRMEMEEEGGNGSGVTDLKLRPYSTVMLINIISKKWMRKRMTIELHCAGR